MTEDLTAEQGAEPTSMAEAEKLAAELLAKRSKSSEEPKSDAADSTDGATGDESGQAPEPTKEDETWEARFKGLQPKYQTLAEAYKADKATWEESRLKLGGKLSEAETALGTANKSIEQLQGELDSSAKATKELQTLVDDLERKGERHALIMSEYPDLAALEAKGLLPQDVEGDELTSALDELRSVLKTSASRILQDQYAGATGDSEHRSGSRTQGDDVSSISEMLMVANRKGDAAEISRLTALLVEAQNAEYAKSS